MKLAIAISKFDFEHRDLELFFRSVIFVFFDQSNYTNRKWYKSTSKLMIRWFLKLSQIPEVIEVPSFSGEALSYLQGLIDGFTISDALEVKNIEKVTNHDVKAVEYFLKQKCQSHPEIAKVLEFFHFVCTSEDINNLAHALMLKEALNTVIFPVMDEVIKAVCDMAKANAHVPMFSRTHGQRDLTDSTVLRNMGEGLGHSLLAYRSALQGISKLQVNEASLFEDLNESWEVLAEPIQTVLLTQLGTLELLQKTWKRCGIILLLVKSGANLGRNRGKVRFSHDAENRPYLSRVEPEMVVGWYHSHPGFGCWLSGVDINTQQALIHGLNRHYYSIAINYRKNELEEKMLLNLHKKKWTDGLTLQRFDTHSKTNEQTVQKMQKQMSVMVTVLVTKEGKRLETALGRSMEKAVKANTDALWAHFQEENAKQEKLVRERTQQITSLITNCINKDLPAMVEKTVKKELAAVGPAVARAISPAIEKTISTAITEAFQRGVGDKAVNQLEKSVNSKLEATVARQIQAQFQTSGKQALQDALKSSLEASVIPAFEMSCKAMFEQVDATFQKGMIEHATVAQQQFESTHSPLALALRVNAQVKPHKSRQECRRGYQKQVCRKGIVPDYDLQQRLHRV
ncbi:unnamed protein product [Camellia sinensis]